ncbi:MAG: adenosylmethionine--8-amino-7-oxononanoate transaminase [Proteobacteria bacterium]|nr:MAG: adenosylmethionine--8-amino-7-oxononanoate transaminase [Pseudomonadota bacterium]
MTIDLEFDKTHIWHPYTSMTHPLPSFPVTSANGCRIFLEDGTSLVDGMASWWCAVHGYNVPELNRALIDQSGRMSHVMFGGLTHQPATELCQLLVSLTPKELTKVFLADSGSVSVEVALKMALQYWQGKGVVGKTRFAAFRHAYHGDTFGAMSVCDPENGMHSLFKGFLSENVFLPAPPNGFDVPVDGGLISQWRAVLQQRHAEIAALIVEPVVQGAGGMRIYNPEYLDVMRDLCDEFDLLLVFDEIATGFGRTGQFFAVDHCHAVPDILCLGKALTGGYMTLAATLTSSNVAEAVCASEAGVFMHGPTFMANPLACHVALTSIRLLINSPWQQRVQSIEEQLDKQLARLQEALSVESVRVKGAIGVVEMKQPLNVADIQKFLVSEGVWIRPFGKLLYIMPPFIISEHELNVLTGAMEKVVNMADEAK